MADDPLKRARDQKLDDLAKAFDDYVKKETKRLDGEANYIRNVIKARGSATSLAKANAAASKLLVANDISSFLAG